MNIAAREMVLLCKVGRGLWAWDHGTRCLHATWNIHVHDHVSREWSLKGSLVKGLDETEQSCCAEPFSAPFSYLNTSPQGLNMHDRLDACKHAFAMPAASGS